jgi:hypothetical protein
VTIRIDNSAQPINAPLIESAGWLVDSFRASNLAPSSHPALADSNVTPPPVDIAALTLPQQAIVPTR